MPSFKKFLRIGVIFLILSAATFRILLLSPLFLELTLSDEKKLYYQQQTSNNNNIIPWSSVDSLKTQYGEGSNLQGREVRDLYKNKLIDDKLDKWVEEQQRETTKNNKNNKNVEDVKIATSCAKMRWHARLYTRTRHNLHPFSTEYLGLRDAWVHGVQKASWRNVISCLAQHEEYPCPGIMDLMLRNPSTKNQEEIEIEMMKSGGELRTSTSKHDEQKNNQEKQEKKKGWIAKTIESCRRTNQFWNEKMLKKKAENDDQDKNGDL